MRAKVENSKIGLWLRVAPVLVGVALHGCAVMPAVMRLPTITPDRESPICTAPTRPSGDPGSLQRACASPVWIAPFQGAGFLNDRHLAYVDARDPDALRRYSSLAWEEAPVSMVEQAAVRYLKDVPIAETVFGPRQAGIAATQLDASLERFELQICGSARFAVVQLGLALRDRRGNTISLEGAYCGRGAVPGPQASASEVAGAFAKATSTALELFVADLRQGRARPSESTCRPPCQS